jgi:1-acyl-sn-glycerol-3-phosphate acyltransferase
MLPTSLDFFVAFLGVLLAGGVPVPLYPPFRASAIEDHLRRQAHILDNARAALLIASPETRRAARWLRARLASLRDVVTAPELVVDAPATILPRAGAAPDDVALVQYTSGSTGDPKGVVLTHRNILANVRAMTEAAGAETTDVFVSWLPLYHDMGLIGAWLGSLYLGFRFVVMPPTRFLAQPQSWLQAIHRHRGTLSAAPNFAYEMCATRVADADVAGLRLDTWRIAFNGAEPVSPATLDRFARRFAPLGFRPEAMTPVYGLAENALGLTFPPRGRGPRVDRIRRADFERGGRAEPAASADPAALAFVSSGVPLPGHEIRVVDGSRRELPDRRQGDVQFRGPSATRGYLRNERATRALREGPWLNTGDRGYTTGGELYVSGRSKDVIIRAGRHVFPYELEDAVGTMPGMRRGGVAVFSCPDDRLGTERVVIVAETRERDPARLAELRARIDERSAALLGTAAEEIVLAPPRTVPKTSSGKTRRAACRQMYLAGELGRRRSLRRQMAALAVRALAPQALRAARRVAEVAYASWFWLWFGLLAVPAWALAVAVPGARRRRRAVSAVARAFFAIAGARLEARGLQRLPDRPCVLVMNHPSYLDGLVAMAVLPPGFDVAAKRELLDNPLLRAALPRLGLTFVERFDARQGVEDAARLAQRLRAGRSLVLFPEGTTHRAAGVHPFHMGAFVAAARTGASVVPTAVTGTRAALRSHQWFPRRAAITVTALPPLQAADASWHAALALRDRAREVVAEAAGEALVEAA